MNRSQRIGLSNHAKPSYFISFAENAYQRVHTADGNVLANVNVIEVSLRN